VEVEEKNEQLQQRRWHDADVAAMQLHETGSATDENLPFEPGCS
jgi:hypothetical protein